MYPTQQAGMALRTLSDIKAHYGLPDRVWTCFTEQVGDPGDDLKLLGALPPRSLGRHWSELALPTGAHFQL